MRYVKYVVAYAAVLLLAASVGYAQTDAPKAATPSGDATRGKELFVRYGCTQCHGTDGQGAGTGPRLGPNPIPLVAFIHYVRSPGGLMPPYTEKALKSDQELTDIHAYLSTRPKAASPDVLKALGLSN